MAGNGGRGSSPLVRAGSEDTVLALSRLAPRAVRPRVPDQARMRFLDAYTS
jgi:hypothetical protein